MSQISARKPRNKIGLKLLVSMALPICFILLNTIFFPDLSCWVHTKVAVLPLEETSVIKMPVCVRRLLPSVPHSFPPASVRVLGHLAVLGTHYIRCTKINV